VTDHFYTFPQSFRAHQHLVPRLRMHGATPLLPASIARSDNFTFTEFLQFSDGLNQVVKQAAAPDVYKHAFSLLFAIHKNHLSLSLIYMPGSYDQNLDGRLVYIHQCSMHCNHLIHIPITMQD